MRIERRHAAAGALRARDYSGTALRPALRGGNALKLYRLDSEPNRASVRVRWTVVGGRWPFSSASTAAFRQSGGTNPIPQEIS